MTALKTSFKTYQGDMQSDPHKVVAYRTYELDEDGNPFNYSELVECAPFTLKGCLE